MPTSLDQNYQCYVAEHAAPVHNKLFMPEFLSGILREPKLPIEEFIRRFKSKYPDQARLAYQPHNEIQIAAANVARQYLKIDGLPLWIYYSTRFIPRYAPLGINYGSCWKIQESASHLFNPQGKLLKHTAIPCDLCAAVILARYSCYYCDQPNYCSWECSNQQQAIHNKGCAVYQSFATRFARGLGHKV